jgi:hypothetical protein
MKIGFISSLFLLMQRTSFLGQEYPLGIIHLIGFISSERSDMVLYTVLIHYSLLFFFMLYFWPFFLLVYLFCLAYSLYYNVSSMRENLLPSHSLTACSLH